MNKCRVVVLMLALAHRCQYRQIESGVFHFANLANASAPVLDAIWQTEEVPNTLGTCGWGHRTYTDAIGKEFTSPLYDGLWISKVLIAPSITLECVSSDGTKKLHPVSVPPPPNPGRFPAR